MLAGAAEEVYSRYDDAPDRVDTQLAEKFLRLANLAAICSSSDDPLGLVLITGGRPSINSAHKAIVSVKDHLEMYGSRDGKALLEVFSSPPFGWSPDTLRYIVAAMLMGGMIELKISGTTVTTSGQHAIDALKTNKSFSGSVNVSLRGLGPTIAELARSAERVSELTGQPVNPLEHEICTTVQKHFPKLQGSLGALSERLQALGAPGTDRVRTLVNDIDSMLFIDASNAPHELGVESSSLYDTLLWAKSLAKALDEGLEKVIHDLRRHAAFIDGIPATGIPGELKEGAAESIKQFKTLLSAADFHEHAADFRGILTELDTQVRNASVQLAEEQKRKIHDGRMGLLAMPEFRNLNQDLQQSAIAQLEKFEPELSPGIDGFETMVTKDYDIGSTLSALQAMVHVKEQERIKTQIEEERKKSSKFLRTKKLKAKISSVQQLDSLIAELSTLKAEAEYFASVDITIEIEG
jgi:hypothetical protein